MVDGPEFASPERNPDLVEFGGTGPADEIESQEVAMERPPGPAVVWQRIREMERKVEVLWLKNVNDIRLAGRSSLVSWRCKGNPDQPKEGCDFVMESTPQGQAKVPALICPRHGKVPFEILEA
jgi:hypothetical protein